MVVCPASCFLGFFIWIDSAIVSENKFAIGKPCNLGWTVRSRKETMTSSGGVDKRLFVCVSPPSVDSTERANRHPGQGTVHGFGLLLQGNPPLSRSWFPHCRQFVLCKGKHSRSSPQIAVGVVSPFVTKSNTTSRVALHGGRIY